jgi:hypothetical protein
LGCRALPISRAAVERLKPQDQIIKVEAINVVGAAGVTLKVELLLIKDCRVASLRQYSQRPGHLSSFESF